MVSKPSANTSLGGTQDTLFSPLRISGLAIESLFSQYKHNAGGKLDACTL